MKEYGIVLENQDLSQHTTIGIGGICKYLVKPYSIESLAELIKYLNNNHYKYYILGNGSNVLLDDSYFDGVIIKLDNFKNIEYFDDRVIVDAGVFLPLLVSDTMQHGYTSLFFAAMIPGCVGGSCIGNAGAYGHEIMEYVERVKVIDYLGNIKVLNKNEIKYGYRHTSLKDRFIICSVTFNLEKGNVAQAQQLVKENRLKRQSSQPLEKKNMGSVFRNPENDSAGRIIESVGLKNYHINDARVSEKHANFIVNDDHSSFRDVYDLIKYVKDTVKKEKNIDLVLEPIVVKWNKL